jgi:choline dehydrogenase-like flavoprotein
MPVAEPDASGVVTADIAIIGSGMGGSTVAHALSKRGAKVLVVERGDFLPREVENWSPTAVFGDGRYRNAEQWFDRNGASFDPGTYYYVGGNTKFYGAMLTRFREADFSQITHREGVSPAWPFGYDVMEPHYAEAERLFRVHGAAGHDPTDPWRSGEYPHQALEHEPEVQRLADRLTAQGLRPFAPPAAVDLGPLGRCVRCATCDGFPCMVDAKGDADVSALRPAMQSGSVELLTRTRVESLIVSGDGKSVVEARATRDGAPTRIVAGRFVVAAGAANTAALLLKSVSEKHPNGLGNSSGLIGRNYMVHNSTFLVAVDPRRKNSTRFQKTLAFNDWYLGSDTEYPLGHVQMLGKLRTPMISQARKWVPGSVLRYMTDHSLDLYITSEDLPDPENRVKVDREGRISVHWTPNNLATHRELVRRTTSAMRRAGYPLVFTERMGIATNSHMCGTVVMGDDPSRSVLDDQCRMHDVLNVWVADSSSFPSSAAINPALTIAANALRIVRDGDLAA